MSVILIRLMAVALFTTAETPLSENKHRKISVSHTSVSHHPLASGLERSSMSIRLTIPDKKCFLRSEFPMWVIKAEII